jgi:hypothetical protein
MAEFAPVRMDRSPRSAGDGAEERVRDHGGVTDKPADPHHGPTDHGPDDQTGHRTDDPGRDLASDPTLGPTSAATCDLTSDQNGQPTDPTAAPPSHRNADKTTDQSSHRNAGQTSDRNGRPAERTGGRASDRAKRRRPSLDEIFGDVLPATTSDEREPEAPSGNRDSWYEQNRPPHHDQG